MNDVKTCCFFNSKFKVKPSSADAAILSTIIAEKTKSFNNDTIKSFVNMVGKEGVTFCPSTFKEGKRNKESFDQMQLLALDFDNGISFQAVKERADRYDLPMLFAYDTFSSKEHNKFRVVFLNDVSINEPRTAEATMKALGTIFPEADDSCWKDIARMYYGGKGLLFFDDSLPQTNIEAVFRNMSLCLKNKYGVNHYKRKIAEFSNTTGIALNDKKLLDVSVSTENAEITGTDTNGKNTTNSSIILTNNTDNLPNKYYLINFTNSINHLGVKKKDDYSQFRSSDFEDIRSNCRLFQEFESGHRRLHHNELVGLATNIIQGYSGISRFKYTLSAHSYFEDYKKYSAWNYYLNYFKQQNYKPESCVSYCPYHESCQHGTNIVSTVKVKHHHMEKLDNYIEHFVSLDKGVEDFRRALYRANDAQAPMWYIIKAQTALGKTETLLQLIKNSQLKILVAVPTIVLKHEIWERAVKMLIDMIEAPSLRESKEQIPDHVWEHLDKLYSSGKSVLPYLRKIIGKNDSECLELFQQYIKDLEDFRNFTGHAITTHKRLLTLDTSKYDLVIIDEDIIFGTIIKNKAEISVPELKKLLEKAPLKSELEVKIRELLKQAKTNDEFFTLPKIAYNESYADITMGIDISAFCAATHFCLRKNVFINGPHTDCFSFFMPVEFDKNTKFIMLSATVNETVCNYYFGEENVNFYECKKAKYEGVLNQYHDKSMSRFDIDKDTSVLDKIKNWSGFEYNISFKKYDYYELHFGNTEGCDFLKGKNINVIGTPHQPEWIYKLFAYSIGLDFCTDERLKAGATATHNGYKFRFMTFDDEALRTIQFYFIESDLEQAVGRARLLRCNCVVNLFSNFPVCQAVMKVSEYER